MGDIPELLPWPEHRCSQCFFFSKSQCTRPGDIEDTFLCFDSNDKPIVWLTKEEWLKRRIRE